VMMAVYRGFAAAERDASLTPAHTLRLLRHALQVSEAAAPSDACLLRYAVRSPGATYMSGVEASRMLTGMLINERQQRDSWPYVGC
jgi:hypothetical protein